MFRVFEDVVRGLGIEHDVAVVRRTSDDGVVDVRVISPRPLGFSRFFTWVPEFEEQVQRQVSAVAPTAVVRFEWDYPDGYSDRRSRAAEPAAPPVSWEHFTGRLATVLEEIPYCGVVQLNMPNGQCIQFLAEWICSIGGNMTDVEGEWLRAAGWTAPDDKGMPTWQIELAFDTWSCERVAAQAVDAMVRLFRLAAPTDLTVTVWCDALDTPDPDVAILGLREA